MFDRSLLEALAAVVESGSFEGAARRLSVTPSAVSQRIKALEREAGTVVVRRSRPAQATPSGEVLVRMAGQYALLDREASRALNIGGDEPFPMTVAVNADSVATWFLPALDAAGLTHARYRLRIEDEAYSIQLLRDGTAMAAVTSETTSVQGCALYPLGALSYQAVASAAFAREHLRAGLARAPRMRFDSRDELQERFLALAGQQDGAAIPHEVPSSLGFLTAVRLGWGWGAVPCDQAEPFLASGELVDVLPGLRMDVPLYWHHWRLDSPALAALTAAVRAGAANALTALDGQN